MTAYTLPPGVWRREALVEVKRSLRLPQFLLPTVLTPAAFYGLFTLAIAKAPSPVAAAASLAGYGVFAAIGPALFGFGAGVAMEREQGLIELKRVSPMPASAYVIVKLAAAVLATAMAVIAIDLLAIVAGVRLSPAKLGGTDRTPSRLRRSLRADRLRDRYADERKGRGGGRQRPVPRIGRVGRPVDTLRDAASVDARDR